MKLILFCLLITGTSVLALQCNSTGTLSNTSTTCTCKQGFWGTTCQNICLTDSLGRVCSGRGICNSTTGACMCYGTGVSGDYCEVGCQTFLVGSTVHICGDHGRCINNGTLAERCVCDYPYAGLNCTECVSGQFGTNCASHCVGKYVNASDLSKGWNNCYGNGVCIQDNLTCACTPPYLAPDCTRTHYGIGAPSLLLSTVWADFTPHKVMVNESFQLFLSGYRTYTPPDSGVMKVKISGYRGTCVGVAAGSAESVVGADGSAWLMAPNMNGTYSMCLNWRMDWELFGSVNLEVALPDTASILDGFSSCAEYIKNRQPAYCGCYFKGTGDRRINLPMQQLVSQISQMTGDYNAIQQGCCWGTNPAENAVIWKGPNWGICSNGLKGLTPAIDQCGGFF